MTSSSLTVNSKKIEIENMTIADFAGLVAYSVPNRGDLVWKIIDTGYSPSDDMKKLISDFLDNRGNFKAAFCSVAIENQLDRHFNPKLLLSQCYVIEFSCSIKVGISRTPEQRVKAICSNSGKSLIRFLQTPKIPEKSAFKIERITHSNLENYRLPNTREWFNCDFSLAVKTLHKTLRQYKYGKIAEEIAA